MNRNLLLTTALAVSVWLTGEVVAGGPRGSQGRAGNSRGGAIQRYWQAPGPVGPTYRYDYHRPYYPYYSYYPHYYGNNPRSIIIITPSRYYPYAAPFTVLTSEPYYCHMHHVGFISRIGFLDHISGTHKIPLDTANSICAETNESCIIEGY
jgi:hypothetical protein